MGKPFGRCVGNLPNLICEDLITFWELVVQWETCFAAFFFHLPDRAGLLGDVSVLGHQVTTHPG